MIEMYEELEIRCARGIWVHWPLNKNKFTTSFVISMSMRGTEDGKSYWAFYNVVRSRTVDITNNAPPKNDVERALLCLSEQRAFELDLKEGLASIPELMRPKLRQATRAELQKMGYWKGKQLRFQFGQRIK